MDIVMADAATADAGKKESLSELIHIHECLRSEIATLRDRSIALLQSLGSSSWSTSLENMLRQFDYLFVVYHSHSKAEDDIILPALVNKGLDIEARNDLKKEHDGHVKYFEEIKLLLTHLRGSDVQSLGDKSINLKNLVQHLVETVDRLSSSLLLHFRHEEEELLPFLAKHFSDEELKTLMGYILGDRPSELIIQFLDMISRDLPPDQQLQVVKNLRDAASGTHFEKWLNSVAFDSNLNNITRSNSNGLPACLAAASNGGLRNAGVEYHKEELHLLGCQHYSKNCKILAKCCDKLYTCRLCHDDAVLHSAEVGKVKWHKLNRYEVETMYCMLCNYVQPVASHCGNCKQSMSSYYCSICHLYDNDLTHPIYHCPFCNICRKGKGLGIDFFHCMKCNACISMKARNHKCIEQIIDGDCPICGDDLFTSNHKYQMFNCGHVMHRSCFDQYSVVDYRCPVCRKTIIDMSHQWKQLDEIRQVVLNNYQHHQVNEQVKRIVTCNDCEQKSLVLGNKYIELSQFNDKCPSCGSYNTRFEYSNQ